MITVETKTEIKGERITNMLVGIIEMGGNYSPWFGGAELEGSIVPVEKGENWYAQDKIFEDVFNMSVTYDDPDEDEGTFSGNKTLNDSDFKNGLEWLAKSKYSKHFQDFINENDDAITHDVVMQAIIFQDIIYG